MRKQGRRQCGDFGGLISPVPTSGMPASDIVIGPRARHRHHQFSPPLAFLCEFERPGSIPVRPSCQQQFDLPDQPRGAFGLDVSLLDPLHQQTAHFAGKRAG